MRSEDDDVVATRIFERDDGEVVLLLHRPRPHTWPGETEPDQNTSQCRYTLRFPDGEVFHGRAVGIDRTQALVLALSSASVDLRYKNRGERRTAIRWLGGDDLGLSIPHHD